MPKFLRTVPAKLLTLVLLAQATLFYGLSRGERTIPARPLSEIPRQAQSWHMLREHALDDELRNSLRADDYLERDYADARGQTVNLFIAYFGSQKAGQSPHSPKNCLPGSGWVWTVSDIVTARVPGRATAVEINRYIVSKGEQQAVVLYWYQSRDRVVANELRAAAFTAWDALRYNRTDTALIRVVAPAQANQEAAATQAGLEFIETIFASIRGVLPH
ncbi:MAG TPA: EpsI family protein [Bryobacteraceae bacterium]|nr:EpsI family protein [Bryobacteraceae bacterium]